MENIECEMQLTCVVGFMDWLFKMELVGLMILIVGFLAGLIVPDCKLGRLKSSLVFGALGFMFWQAVILTIMFALFLINIPLTIIDLVY